MMNVRWYNRTIWSSLDNRIDDRLRSGLWCSKARVRTARPISGFFGAAFVRQNFFNFHLARPSRASAPSLESQYPINLPCGSFRFRSISRRAGLSSYRRYLDAWMAFWKSDGGWSLSVASSTPMFSNSNSLARRDQSSIFLCIRLWRFVCFSS